MRELSACANLYGWGRRDFSGAVSQWAELLDGVCDYPQCGRDLRRLFEEWRNNETRFPQPQVILQRLSAARAKWRAIAREPEREVGDCGYWARLCLAAYRGDRDSERKLMS